MKEAARLAPVIVSGPDCVYHPFALQGQPTECGRILEHMAARGVAYRKMTTPGRFGVGGRPCGGGSQPRGARRGAGGARLDGDQGDAGLARRDRDRAVRDAAGAAVGHDLRAGGGLAGRAVPGAGALQLDVDPYHIGTGYFGGFLPFISQYIVARSGNPFAGLWYTFAVVAMALVVTIFWLPETRGNDLD